MNYLTFESTRSALKKEVLSKAQKAKYNATFKNSDMKQKMDLVD